MDSIYIWNNRVIPQEEIEEGIDRIVNPEKYERKEKRKEILQSLGGSLIGCAIAVALILGVIKPIVQPETTVKSEKTTNIKPQTTNPVVDAVYNGALQHTK